MITPDKTEIKVKMTIPQIRFIQNFSPDILRSLTVGLRNENFRMEEIIDNVVMSVNIITLVKTHLLKNMVHLLEIV